MNAAEINTLISKFFEDYILDDDFISVSIIPTTINNGTFEIIYLTFKLKFLKTNIYESYNVNQLIGYLQEILNLIFKNYNLHNIYTIFHDLDVDGNIQRPHIFNLGTKQRIGESQ